MSRIKIGNLGAVGLVKDMLQEDLPPEAFTDGRNIRFTTQGAGAFLGHKAIFEATDFPLMWLKSFPPLTAPLWVYAGVARIGVWDGAHIDITRVSGPYTGTEDKRWQGEVFNGVGIFNNGVDMPQYWASFSTLQKLVDLPNWPSDVRAGFLRPFKNFLIAGNITEGQSQRRYRVRWSHPAAPGTIPTSWALNDPTKLSGERDLAMSPDYVIDGLTLGDLFLVYKEKSVWAMQPLTTPTVFATWQVLDSHGILTLDCAQNFPGGHFVVGQDDVYVHTGQRGSDNSIVQDRMRKWLFGQISPEAAQHCFTLYNREENELWFCFPESGAPYASLALVWNHVTRSIGIRDLPGIPFASVGSVSLFGEGEGDIWGEGLATAAPTLIADSASIAVEAEVIPL
jgi:hypothetical protein